MQIRHLRINFSGPQARKNFWGVWAVRTPLLGTTNTDRPPHALSLARAGSRTLPSHGASEREERDSCVRNKIEHLIGALPNKYNSMHARHIRRIFLLQFHPSTGEPARSLHAREADRNAAIVCMYAH